MTLRAPFLRPGNWEAEAVCRLSTLRGFIFDIDHTLCDTDAANTSSLERAIRVGIDRGVLPPSGLNEFGRQEFLRLKIKFGVDPLVIPELENALGIYQIEVISEMNATYDMEEYRGIRLFPKVLELLEELALYRRRLGVVTNGDPFRQYQKLSLTGVRSFFRAVVVSDEVGMTKPDPEIFYAAAERLDLHARECCFVGDSPTADMAGANSAGMVSVRVRQGKFSVLEPKIDLERPTFEFADIRTLERVVSIALTPRKPAIPLKSLVNPC